MNRKQRRAETPRVRDGMPAVGLALDRAFNTGLQYHRAGRLEEAARYYRQVLAVRPRHADSLHLLGVIALDTGRHRRAADLISGAIAIDPAQAPYHANLGTAFWKLGALDEAVACYRRALDRDPGYAKAWFNLAAVLWKQGKATEAEAGYRAALRMQPNYPEALDNLGTVLARTGRTDEAIACYRAAIVCRPEFPEAHNNLGTALLEQGQAEAAMASYREAIALRPGFPEAHFNLGTAASELGQPDAAVSHYRNALALRPDYADAWLNLGVALKDLMRLPEAIACYRQAIALEPANAEAHSNLGIALLAAGELPEGWREHEWRWKTPHLIAARRDFGVPLWRGEPAEGRTLLIHAEQGFGDTLQFCRYASMASARGMRVIMEAQPPLVRLLRTLAGVDVVLARGDPLPAFDLHCPMLSLPLAFGTSLETIQSSGRYLHADPARVAEWRDRLAAVDAASTRVGLVWAGNPRRHSRGLTAVDRRRSISPERLAPLLRLPGLRFFSLQKDGPRPAGHIAALDFMTEMEDFADTAALIMNLDLVISVDTAVAHLAGALGKPVWLMDRFDTCWRWLTGRSDSPWYPNLRLFRQPRPGDWDTVLDAIARELTRREFGAAAS